MIIRCPECSAQYRYDEARFGGAPRARVKCPKCGRVFEVTNPAHDAGDATNIGAKKKKADPDGHQTDQVKLVESESPELPVLSPLPGDFRFSLAVITGNQAGTVFPISKPRIYLGRGTSADIQVQDPEVSRRHAMIEIRGEIVTLIDLGATNGTFVEGEKIESRELANQTEFTIGSTTLMVIITNIKSAV